MAECVDTLARRDAWRPEASVLIRSAPRVTPELREPVCIVRFNLGRRAKAGRDRRHAGMINGCRLGGDVLKFESRQGSRRSELELIQLPAVGAGR